jgi:hypothetical protein
MRKTELSLGASSLRCVAGLRGTHCPTNKLRCNLDIQKKTGHLGRLEKYLATSEGSPEPESSRSMRWRAIVRNDSKRATY